MLDARMTIGVAEARDRQEIYAIRHDVYARELKQHAENSAGFLRDGLDDVNVYLVAREHDRVVGFVAITPPEAGSYSIDKYFAREATVLQYDDGLYEVRLLTVADARRHTRLAPLLMYGALRYVESRGGRTIAAIGRLEVLPMYERVGLRRRGLRAVSGAVTYELMSAQVLEFRRRFDRFEPMVRRMERAIDWQVPGVPYHEPSCYHGGAFWEALGDRFDHLDRSGAVINADVLDAWFDPAPQVLERLTTVLPFALRTSPPTHGEGLRAAIAEARGVPESSVLPGAGSSDLIFGALGHWVRPGARVLILDPMYGEYAHLLEQIAGAQVDRLALKRADDYDLDPDTLARAIAKGYDWVVLVNPNSPTGRHVSTDALRRILAPTGPPTRVWVDETYLEYVGPDRSLERFAAASSNVVVCKSMSKVYALSGVRAAYLVGPAALIEELRPLAPPWAVSLPAQITACAALGATEYYAGRWRQTHVLREELQRGLEALGWAVTPGCANFLLCEVPERGPDAGAIVTAARGQGLFLRDAGNMGRTLGTRAVRIAVKDGATNARMLRILAETGASASRGARVTTSPAPG